MNNLIYEIRYWLTWEMLNLITKICPAGEFKRKLVNLLLEQAIADLKGRKIK